MSSSSLSIQQERALAITPKFTAACSIPCSLFLIYEIYCEYVQNPRKVNAIHRTLLGMSAIDVLSSTAWFLSTWAVPAGSFALATGNRASCTFQGFLLQLAIGPPLYNSSLALFYLLIIKYRWTDEMLARVERWVHVLILSFAVGTSVLLLPLQQYNHIGAVCWVIGDPQECGNSSFQNNPDLPCRRGNHAWIYGVTLFYGPLWICVASCVGSMICIYRQVQITLKRLHRYSINGRVTHALGRSQADPSRVAHQALLYTLSFLITWMPSTLWSIAHWFNWKNTFWLDYAAALCEPTQGLWNLIIFARHRASTKQKLKRWAAQCCCCCNLVLGAFAADQLNHQEDGSTQEDAHRSSHRSSLRLHSDFSLNGATNWWAIRNNNNNSRGRNSSHVDSSSNDNPNNHHDENDDDDEEEERIGPIDDPMGLFDVRSCGTDDGDENVVAAAAVVAEACAHLIDSESGSVDDDDHAASHEDDKDHGLVNLQERVDNQDKTNLDDVPKIPIRRPEQPAISSSPSPNPNDADDDGLTRSCNSRRRRRRRVSFSAEDNPEGGVLALHDEEQPPLLLDDDRTDNDNDAPRERLRQQQQQQVNVVAPPVGSSSLEQEEEDKSSPPPAAPPVPSSLVLVVPQQEQSAGSSSSSSSSNTAVPFDNDDDDEGEEQGVDPSSSASCSGQSQHSLYFV